jgi:hypothetical protein
VTFFPRPGGGSVAAVVFRGNTPLNLWLARVCVFGVIEGDRSALIRLPVGLSTIRAMPAAELPAAETGVSARRWAPRTEVTVALHPTAQLFAADGPIGLVWVGLELVLQLFSLSADNRRAPDYPAFAGVSRFACLAAGVYIEPAGAYALEILPVLLQRDSPAGCRLAIVYGSLVSICAGSADNPGAPKTPLSVAGASDLNLWIRRGTCVPPNPEQGDTADEAVLMSAGRTLRDP